MLGTVCVQNLKVNCIVGIHPHEREKEQELFLDLEIIYDFEKAQNSEHVDNALDYTELSRKTEELLILKKYQLIETAAEEIAQLIFGRWKMAKECSIYIKKPDAISNADFAAVKILRKNKDN